MNEESWRHRPGDNTLLPKRNGEHYHSVEFCIEGIELPYHFKIWNTANMSMCVLVKENSAILPRLKVGETLDMKFYSVDSTYPTDSLRTTIRHITKDDKGRFKGHYLVALEILGNPSQERFH